MKHAHPCTYPKVYFLSHFTKVIPKLNLHFLTSIDSPDVHGYTDVTHTTTNQMM